MTLLPVPCQLCLSRVSTNAVLWAVVALRMLSVQPGTRFGNGMCLPWASLLVRRNVRDCSDMVVTVGATVGIVHSVM